MKVHFRRLPNGLLIAPKRGAPPAIPEGYEVYYNDPYTLAPILPVCKYRIYVEPPDRCCGKARSMRCEHPTILGHVVRFQCADCGGKE